MGDPQTNHNVKTGFHQSPHPPPDFSNFPQEYIIPPGGTRTGGTVAPMQEPPHTPSYYTQVQQDPAETGLVLALNPSRNQFLHTGHQPQMDRPWWMWAVAIIEVIIALSFACKVAYNIMTADRFITDRNTLMWAFFLIFLSLAVQFMMGVSLLVGLKSSDQNTTLWYCQAWTCGAYFLFVETGFLLLGIILQLDSRGEDVSHKFMLIIIKTSFRVVAFILVRRFMFDISGKCRERAEAEERYWQYCHQQQFQQPLPPEQLDPSNNPQEQQQQQQQGRNWGNNEYLYYAPQMSLLMTMMMNNSSGSVAN